MFSGTTVLKTSEIFLEKSLVKSFLSKVPAYRALNANFFQGISQNFKISLFCEHLRIAASMTEKLLVWRSVYYLLTHDLRETANLFAPLCSDIRQTKYKFMLSLKNRNATCMWQNF